MKMHVKNLCRIIKITDTVPSFPSGFINIIQFLEPLNRIKSNHPENWFTCFCDTNYKN